MNLRVVELRRFFSNAGTIRSKGVMPVLDYIKIDRDRIIKTNLNAYVIMNITPVGETILIDEKILNAMVKSTSSDIIEVTTQGSKVFLSDGKYKMSFVVAEEEHYPKMPDSEKENEVVLTQDMLEAIGIAAKNVAVNDVVPAFNCVNLAYGYIAGSDHARLYLKKFDNLPTVLIEPLAANIISQFGEVKYYERGNYSFFEVGSFLFGFIKTAGNPIDFRAFLSEVVNDTYAEFSCQDIYNFIDLFMASSGGETVSVDFNGDLISFKDLDREVSNESVLAIEGQFKPQLSFLPRLINNQLKSIGKEKVRMSPLKSNPGVTFWYEDEPNLVAILGTISK
jgi:hypothetical protein